VQRRLGLRDLHLGGGHTAPLGPLDQPASDESLAGAVFAPDRLERRAAGGDLAQLLLDGRLEPVQPDGELIEPGAGDRAAPQGVDDLGPSAFADLGHAHLESGQVGVRRLR
jgi:hypothetical protein